MGNFVLRSLKDIWRIAPKALVIQLACMMGQSILASANTWLAARFINLIYAGDFKMGMMYLCTIWVVFAVSETADSIFYSCMIQIDSRVGMQLGMELAEKGANFPLIRYEDAEAKNRLKRAHDCMEQGWLSELSLSVFNISAEVLKVAGMLFVLAGFSPVLAGVSLLSVIPYFVVRIIRGREFYELKKYQTGSERRRKYLYHLFGDKRAVKELRIFRIEDYIEQKLYETRDKMNDQLWKFKKRDIRSFFGCEIFCKIGYAASIVTAVLLLLEHKLDLGMLAASLTTFSSFQTAAKYFLINLGRIPECAAFVKDYYTLSDEVRGPEDIKSGMPFADDFMEIEIKDLCFSYPGTARFALDHVSFVIKKNESVAIVGENGSGKTTLVRLLTGLYHAQSGSIIYGTQDIQALDPKAFYKMISIVSQDFVKYEMSVRENIAVSDWKNMGNTGRIRQILNMVGLSEIGSSDLLEETLGNEFGGRELSTGQWQKAAIARGLFQNSSRVIFLDEPTAALDPIMETNILKMFLEIAKEKTAVIVSHRIGICREADKIIVMKNGRAAEIGSHEELLQKQGEYYRLYTLQRKWYVK